MSVGSETKKETDITAQVEELKTIGNSYFSEGRNEEAVECFTKALEIVTSVFSLTAAKPQDGEDSEKTRRTGAILLSNRANAYLRLGRFEMALEDASLAVNIDPEYPKSYFRRGTALFNIGRIKEAYADFVKAGKLCPNDVSIGKKIRQCEKQIDLEEAALREGDPNELSKLMERVGRECLVPGSVFSPPTKEEAEQNILISFPQPTEEEIKNMTAAFVKGGMLHPHCVARLLIAVSNLLKAEDNVVYLEVPKLERLTVVGDLHGQFFDLLRIFETNGAPSPTNAYLFNGDFVDRGSWGCEIVLTLFAYKLLYPGSVFLNRGNHEAVTMNRVYGFEGEVVAKCGQQFVPLFTYTFSCLPLAHIINKSVIVVHGGLHPGASVSDIAAINRIVQPPDTDCLYANLLWADPRPQNGWSPSNRGIGIAFGPDITSSFLSKNGLRLVIRSHEVAMEGYRIAHGGKLVTLFSAPNYCDRASNLGAYAVFTGSELRPEFFKFAASPHPPVPPMKYVSQDVKSMLGLM